MIGIGDLVIRYSGGASNTLQGASLGGAMSTDPAGTVASQIPDTYAPMTGVTIIDARGNAEGVGTIRWVPSTNTLLWKPPGSVSFNGVVISANGTYSLGSSSGYLIVAVTLLSLPSVPRDEFVTIVAAINRTFDNVSPLESLQGSIDYRCFYITNTSALGSAYDMRMWIKNQPIGDDTLAVALHPGGKNINAPTLLNEADTTNVLSAIVWQAPATQGSGLLLGDLAPGDRYAFWVKRIVPENTFTQVINNKSSLGFSALM